VVTPDVLTTLVHQSGGPAIQSVTTTAGGWRDAVSGLNQSNIAHAPEWFTAIRQAYGHEPLYLSAVDEEGRPGLLPAFVIRRPLLGAIVTSMPFLDAGGPCSSSAALASLLVDRLIGEARHAGASAIELRCTAPLPLSCQPMTNKVSMTLELPADPDRLWRQLNGSLRNQIRKAERSGLSIDCGGLENLPAFYDTFVVRMRDLGSPVHAFDFLDAVITSFGDRARVVLVRKGRTPVGGLIALGFKDRLIVPWATCLKDYFALCPNMLLYWETLRIACLEGVRRFDFGRSSRGSGTYQFKRQWGAQEEPLFWYTIPIASRRRPSQSNDGRVAAFLTKSWSHLPLAATRALGPRIRKYLTL
jgi:FemAB-related protein (PEP-CTERM system-associated)